MMKGKRARNLKSEEEPQKRLDPIHRIPIERDSDYGEDTNPHHTPLIAPGVEKIDVFMGNVVPDLVQKLKDERYSVVFGCVAWLTHEGVLKGLADKIAQVVVQKEDFLRPDLPARAGAPPMDKARLRTLYYDIRGIDRNQFGLGMNCNGDPDTEGVRCVGYSKDAGRGRPVMHNKFLVFGELEVENHYGGYDDKGELEIVCQSFSFVPKAVWTGSANLTSASEANAENAMWIESQKVAMVYYREWKRMLVMSEPLDWDSDYVAPEYRYGT